jgi:hypothetical protein
MQITFTIKYGNTLVSARQVRVSQVKYVLNRVNRRDGYSVKNAYSSVR